ncbi:MAG: hypothetical protein FVQ80_07000 [Planctomycetes bacterium]|nr:hypothetical protein [Planctomycetota bacterium]
MKVLSFGTLSDVTGGALVSGVSTSPINISNRQTPNLGIWVSVEGDTGRTGGSVAVFTRYHYQKSGSSYALSATPAFIVKSGTSISGDVSTGMYYREVISSAPWMKVAAVSSKSGSTQHGSGVSTTLAVKWAVLAV